MFKYIAIYNLLWGRADLKKIKSWALGLEITAKLLIYISTWSSTVQLPYNTILQNYTVLHHRRWSKVHLSAT